MFMISCCGAKWVLLLIRAVLLFSVLGAEVCNNCRAVTRRHPRQVGLQTADDAQDAAALLSTDTRQPFLRLFYALLAVFLSLIGHLNVFTSIGLWLKMSVVAIHDFLRLLIPRERTSIVRQERASRPCRCFCFSRSDRKSEKLWPGLRKLRSEVSVGGDVLSDRSSTS